ncbi:MAG: hypothetical protein JWM80_1189 [Cyanobacteria bacterium RYN_339]|nr:hypothetical protein [Cyanobacteria bacterium RYN_339]
MSLAEIATKSILTNLPKAAGKGEATVVEAVAKKAASSGGMVDHAVFFDTNFDRKISVKESRVGLQDLNFGQKISYVLALIANFVLGEGVRAPAGSSLGYRFKNMFTVDLDNLMRSAMAETGGVPLDPLKRVAGQMKFDIGNKGSLTIDEISKWVDAEHPGGKNGRTKLGFKQLFQAGADTTKTVTVNGVETKVPAMSRQALEHFYQGKLFYDIAARNGHPHPLPPGT